MQVLDGSGLRLHGRLLGHADLQQAQHLVPAWLPLAPAVRAAVPSIWTRLLGHPGFNADVIEDLNRPAGQRIVGLGVAVALDERWTRLLRENPPPYAPALLYEELLDGRFRPPADKDLARLNARGEVSFLVLHYEQMLTDLANPDTLELLGVAMSLFRFAHAGYRLHSLYQEATAEQGGYMLSMGFRARTTRQQAGLPELYGLQREEAALLLPGSPVRDAFQFTPPRFGFAASERRLLRLAVTDLTDPAIGDELGISGHGVKKLWRQVYQRVQDTLPSLFGDSSAPAAGSEGGGRGPEKRRALLQYLRQHPEELRPYSASAAVTPVARTAALGLLLQRLRDAPATLAPTLAYELYLRLSVFIGENLAHMAEEESVMTQSLWAHFSDEEIAALEAALQASVAPQEMAFYLDWMAQGMNASETATVLGGARQGVPAEVFAQMAGTAQAAMPATRWAQVADALGLAPAAGPTTP